MRVENHDFFYYDPNFQGENGDFTDNEVFSPDKRKEFLEHYSDFIRKTYHLPEKSQKAVREEEAKELTELMGGPISSPKVSRRIDFTHMQASLCKKTETCQTAEQEEPIGEVLLPYSVGNVHNCQKILVLRREFEAEAGKRALLKINSIDPSGMVFLDSECIAETDNFEGIDLDITEQLKKGGKHLLEIRVNPREPEALFGRNQNVDLFNGWFCEEVSLEIINEVEIIDPKVKTLFAKEKTAKANFSCKTDKNCNIRIYMAPSWPAKGEELLIGEYPCEKELSVDEKLAVNLWSAETPELYDIRFEAVLNGSAVDDTLVETGFRTVERRKGGIYINGRKTTLKGGRMMQYLPPHSETSTTHICPRDWQITWQYLMIKRRQGNMLALNILGYGTNDVRFARYADRLGVMLIWTTRYIDSLGEIESDGNWCAKEGYIRQISKRLNHPSIVMWEGANELRCKISDVDRLYNTFASAVESVDTTRLLYPQFFKFSEVAVVGRQDHDTKEAREIFFSPCSSGSDDQDALGFEIKQEDWRISQAYQALCGAYAIKRYRIMDTEAIFWSSLMGSADDGGYPESVIDSYGYAKYAYHTMGENFKTITCLNDTTDVKRGADFTVKPVLFAEPNTLRTVTIAVINEQGEAVDIKTYGEVECDDYMMRLPQWKPNLPEKEGYYAVKAVVL